MIEKKHFMGIAVILTEEEIMKRPNYYELGEFVNTKFQQVKYNGEPERDNDSNKIVHPTKNTWTCSICNKSTEGIDSDYLVGYDHLDCKLKQDMNVEYDYCVLCGKQSPYTRSTHIDFRVGYVEGSGQGCFQPNKCDKY